MSCCKKNLAEATSSFSKKVGCSTLSIPIRIENKLDVHCAGFLPFTVFRNHLIKSRLIPLQRKNVVFFKLCLCIPDTSSLTSKERSKAKKAFLALDLSTKRVTSQLRETEMRVLQSTLWSLRNVVTRNL